MEAWEFELLGDEGLDDAPAIPTFDGIATIQTLLRTHAAELKHQLREVGATLPEMPGDVASVLERADISLDRLLARADANCVSVLVSGALNAGKSSALNALAGTLVCPIASLAATAGLLTLTRSPVDDARCRLFVNPGGDRPLGEPIEVGSTARIYRKMQRINASLRTGNDEADRPESDLVLHVPPSAAPFARGPVALELMDSPGVNEARSPYVSDRWVAALALSDVLVVVLAFDQVQSTDVERFWRRLVAELPSRATAKNLFVFLNKCDQPLEPAELAALQHLCIDAVRAYTNGQIHLAPTQIFVGSALSGLVAQVAVSVDDAMPDHVFHDELAEISKLAVQVVGRRRTPVPQSASALRAMEDWDDVLDASGFRAFLAAFETKTRASVILHVHKLLATVEAATTLVQRHCRTYAASIRQLLAAPDNTVERIRVVRKHIETYFADEAEPSDVLIQGAIQRELTNWLRATSTELAAASASALDELPPSFSASDSAQLTRVLQALLAAADAKLRGATPAFKDALARLVRQRQELVGESFQAVQDMLATFDIALPEDATPASARAANVSDASQDKHLDRVNDWVTSVVAVDLPQLTRQVKDVVRLKVEPGSVYSRALDFSRQSDASGVQATGTFYRARDHVKLGHGQTLDVTFQVDAAFVGHAFVLELSHLTSAGGPKSRAPVTVRVNGHVIRERFCPRAMHEHADNKVGMWSYVTDRWHVDPSFVRATNTVSVTYCDDGTTYYWLCALGFQCTLPPTSTAEIHSKDVKQIFDAALAERMHLGQAQTELLERILSETSPLAALKAALERYMTALARLTDAHEGGRAKQQDTIGALDAASAQCSTILRGCVALINDVAAVATPTL